MNFNNTTVDYEHHPTDSEWQIRLNGAIIVGVINLCGFALCCLTLILTFTSDLKLNNVNLLLANLVLASLLHTFMFVFPQNLYVLYMERLPVSLCRWMGYTFFILAAQMFVFPPFLAINRYVALYHSHKYDDIYKTKNVALMILGSWVLSALIPLPFELGGKTGFDDDNSHCCIVVNDSLWWTIGYCFMILVPLVGVCDGTMVYCNWRIYKKLQEHKETSSLKNNVMTQNRQLFFFMIADTIIPFFFHTLYHVAKVGYTFRENTTLKLFLPTFYSAGVAIRCIAILALLRPYRQAMKNMFGFGQGNKVAPTPTPAKPVRN